MRPVILRGVTSSISPALSPTAAWTGVTRSPMPCQASVSFSTSKEKAEGSMAKMVAFGATWVMT